MQPIIDEVKQVLELGWPGIVLIMVVILWLRINSERDKSAAALGGHIVRLESALDRCHETIKETLDRHDKEATKAWDEAIAQASNAAAIGRQNRDDILAIREFTTGKRA